MRGERNELGALRTIRGVQGVHFEDKTGSTIVRFQDGTFFRIKRQSLWAMQKEATRLELRAKVIRALTTNMEGGAR